MTIARNIQLQTDDGHIVSIDYNVAKCSEVLKEMMNDAVEKDETGPIPLKGIEFKTLCKIIEWANYHKDDEFEDEAESSSISDWDAEFIQIHSLFSPMCKKLIKAASRLEIEGLMNLFEKAWGFWFDPEGKSLEDLNNSFGHGNSAQQGLNHIAMSGRLPV